MRARRAGGERDVSSGVAMEFPFHVRKAHRGRKRVREGPRPKPPQVEEGRVPRISKLMALALHLDQLVRSGALRDFAEAARLGHVSRARILQIMDLLSLPPDVVQDLLPSSAKTPYGP